MGKLYFVFAAVLAGSSLHAQQITTHALTQNAFCAGDSIVVAFDASGTFSPGNVFVAELSDKYGNFAAYTSLGALQSTTSGSFHAKLSASLPSGNAYRVRVAGSSPLTLGSDNGAVISIAAPVHWFPHFSAGHFYSLLGDQVQFQNLTDSTGQFYWDFGADATPQTSTQRTPPPVTYSSVGTKYARLIVVHQATPCGSISDSFPGSNPDYYYPYDSLCPHILSCTPRMTAKPIVVAHDTIFNNNIPSSSSSVHVLSGATVTATREIDNTTFFVEPLGQVNFDGCWACMVYMKAGASITETEPYYFSGLQVIYEPGASLGVPDSVIALLSDHFLPCGNLTFGTTGVQENLSIPGSLHIGCSPNPFHQSTLLNIVPSGSNPITVRIFNALGSCVRTIQPSLATSVSNTVWDGYSSEGYPMPSGMYMAVVSQRTSVAKSPLLLLR